MLDQETKRKINNARDVLVGKVPDPKAQVEQITTALIYKFMDDMDRKAEELGGKPSFFTDGFTEYSWGKLMDKKLSGQERLNLYVEAITKMSQNPHIPQLFRNIFKDAFLPYRAPETLHLFLKEINGFTYDHSENLGNAFEYLLSIMGSQGDAGQFRTPRHIIDFIVDVINPQKDETILDPACGTAGFLISAYKHIIANHDGKDNITGKLTNKEKPLTPDEKKKMMNNFVGYDISPDMVKLSLVNMYLHGFSEPKISEYDTLSNEEKWDESFDVIMANPPFMTPKGGIRPHKRFSVQANRSEVLFVDYILEHLNQKGRAGIIVPEGIIFQSANAYKKLRQFLIEDGLFAVVSLPTGVFNPYSGVKTSILFFDNQIAKKTKNILFLKITDDGFDLGAQRRPIEKNDLPEALDILNKWKKDAREKSFLSGLLTEDGNNLVTEAGGRILLEQQIAHAVSKEKIEESKDYNLSGDRYRETVDYSNIKWEIVRLGNVCEIKTGKKDVNQGNLNGEYPFFTCAKEHTFSDSYSFDAEALLIAGNGDVGAVKYYKGKFEAYQRTYVLLNFKNVFPKYLYHLLLQRFKKTVSAQKLGNTMPYIKLNMLTNFQIPLPPLEIQKEIVAELDGYQKVIDGAEQVVKNWKPSFEIDPKWEKIKLENVTKVLNGRAYKQEELLRSGKYPVLRVGNFFSNRNWYYSDLELDEDKYCNNGDLLYAWSASFGPRIWDGEKSIYHYHIWKIKTSNKLDKHFLFYFLELETENIKSEGGRGVAMIHITKGNFEKMEISLPPLEIQKKIVEKIEEEKIIIEANKKLIKIMERKIEKVIAEI